MSTKTILSFFLSLVATAAMAQVPYVYSVEHTGAKYAEPKYQPFEKLTVSKELPDPLAWHKGKGAVKKFGQWSKRRAEIAHLIQHYEIGTKPVVPKGAVKAQMDGDTLLIDITVGNETLRMSTVIKYPKNAGNGPFPLMIGTSRISLPKPLFDNRPIATLNFNERQVNGYSQFRGDTVRTNYCFTRLYPELIDNGAYSEWAWGMSRIIDALEILGPEKSRIDVSHIGVTGCSYAGKMALFCGAFDERVALVIAQEPGGGGAAAWRASHEMEGVEDLDHTDYHWFKQSLRDTFHGDSVYRLPYDHHELCAMVCPRALLILGNTDYKWLADTSAIISAKAARKVWEKFGIADRMGYSVQGNHPHCMLPESQYPEVEAFIDRFLLGKPVDTDNVTYLK